MNVLQETGLPMNGGKVGGIVKMKTVGEIKYFSVNPRDQTMIRNELFHGKKTIFSEVTMDV